MKKLYTERHGGIKPRIAEVLDDAVTGWSMIFLTSSVVVQGFYQRVRGKPRRSS